MNSDQLALKLGMPWDGISPRYLTRAPQRRKLANEGTGRSIQTSDVAQLEMFPEGTPNGS